MQDELVQLKAIVLGMQADMVDLSKSNDSLRRQVAEASNPKDAKDEMSVKAATELMMKDIDEEVRNKLSTAVQDLEKEVRDMGTFFRAEMEKQKMETEGKFDRRLAAEEARTKVSQTPAVAPTQQMDESAAEAFEDIKAELGQLKKDMKDLVDRLRPMKSEMGKLEKAFFDLQANVMSSVREERMEALEVRIDRQLEEASRLRKAFDADLQEKLAQVQEVSALRNSLETGLQTKLATVQDDLAVVKKNTEKVSKALDDERVQLGGKLKTCYEFVENLIAEHKKEVEDKYDDILEEHFQTMEEQKQQLAKLQEMVG